AAVTVCAAPSMELPVILALNESRCSYGPWMTLFDTARPFDVVTRTPARRRLFAITPLELDWIPRPQAPSGLAELLAAQLRTENRLVRATRIAASSTPPPPVVTEWPAQSRSMFDASWMTRHVRAPFEMSLRRTNEPEPPDARARRDRGRSRL